MAFLLEMGLSESYNLALQLNFDVIGRSLSSDALSRPSGATVYLKKKIGQLVITALRQKNP